MRLIKRIFLLLVIACLSINNLTVCARDRYLSQIDYEGWNRSTTGSVKYLDGSTVLVSIFLNDRGAVWTESDKEQVRKNMDVACDFLVQEGERYNKEVELIYSFDEDSDLSYELHYSKYFPGQCSSYGGDEKKDQELWDMYYYVMDYVHNDIPSLEIMEKYNTDSIGYLIFVDGESTNATAYSYYHNYSTYYEEITFIPLRWSSEGTVNPDTYAHEILHLFGARDLYTTKKISGITKDFVIYAGEEYPEDIMLGYATDGVSWEDSISAEITKLTAYFIGWSNYIYELEEFPSIKTEFRASFYNKQDPPGNYEEFSLKGRKTDEETYKKNIVGRFFEIAILVFFVISLVRDGKRISRNKAVNQQEHIDNQPPFY